MSDRPTKDKAPKQTYDRWAGVYDRTFGRMVEHKLERALDQLHLKAGDRVLDLGVGTGATLPYYPKDVNVVGVDLSEGMLAQAHHRCETEGMTHCQLLCADALLPPFAPESFDHIVMAHTISVVPDPQRAIRCAARLLKPNGRMVLINHFLSECRPIRWAVRALNPLCLRLGWRSDLALNDVLSETDLQLEYFFRHKLFDLWQIVVLRHPEPGRADGSASRSQTTDADHVNDARVSVGMR